jgi:hypothetical protein
VHPRSAYDDAFALRDLYFCRCVIRYSHGYPCFSIADF